MCESSSDPSKTHNRIYFSKEQTDIGREGPMSKGEQPRPLAKVLKLCLSV